MGFETKRALLEHLGKNPNDNKLVDRMILRGEVYREDWMYYIVESEEVVKLKKEIEELKKSDLRWELEEAKAQWEYYQRLYEEECEDKENRIKKCYDWMRMNQIRANWDEFHERIMWDEQD